MKFILNQVGVTGVGGGMYVTLLGKPRFVTMANEFIIVRFY